MNATSGVEVEAHPLSQCHGYQADSYCCGMGNGGGWGWLPAFPMEYTWDPGFRGFLYAVGLIWSFFGVAILSDAFMAGIETITGQTKQVTVKDQDGKDVTIEELVWNPAVANLTLLALGSSAPEIMMSCIEIAASEGYFGAVGAPTIVGSAAFNLFVIIGLCMLAIPEGETRKIDGIPTFILTATFSVLAYLWVCVIVLWSSPNIILVWEALVTFLMMPVLTILVYAADQGYFSFGTKVAPEEQQADQTPDGIERTGSTGSMTSRPQLSAAAQANKDMANYRHAAKGGFMGGGARGNDKKLEHLKQDEEEAHAAGMPVFMLESDKISVLETVGMARLVVMRLGVTDVEATVNFETKDGTAQRGLQFEYLSGSLEFAKGDTEHEIFIKIIHDEKFNDDLSFTLNLTVPDGQAKLGRINSSEITIIDMDGPGIFEWSETTVQKHKSTDSKVPILIERNKGATGEVAVRVKTVDGTAKAGQHFEEIDEDKIFKANVASKPVRIKLMQFEKPPDSPEDYRVSFFVELHEAEKDKAQGATVGEVTRIEVSVLHCVEEEEEEKLTWTDQFRQALSVNGGEDTESAGCVDLTMHYISITWKILAATVPPTHIWNGWATFGVSLMLVGITTGIIGDIATVFSCIVGMDNEIAGIFLVALGTSLPDTFASLLAIKGDDNADNAVGNVTGSNAVNVFLGLGMPWLAATIYWAGVWDSKYTGTAESPGVCRDISTCIPDENAARYTWLAKYQGITGDALENRPWDYQLLTKGKEGDALKAAASMLPEYDGAGGFIVIGGKLGFNTFLFTALCLVAFGLLTLNGCLIGHQAAGGKTGNKIMAGIFFCCWATFIIVGSINVSCDNCLNFLK